MEKYFLFPFSITIVELIHCVLVLHTEKSIKDKMCIEKSAQNKMCHILRLILYIFLFLYRFQHGRYESTTDNFLGGKLCHGGHG